MRIVCSPLPVLLVIFLFMCLQCRFCFVVCALGLGTYRNLFKKFFGSVRVKAY